MEQQNKRDIKISVRTLVEFLMRSGNLDNRFTGRDRLADGARLHRKLQKAYGENDRAEVHFRRSAELDELTFTVIGRADGVLDKDGRVTIDEIKSTTLPLDEVVQDQSAVHWAQAQCYAFMLAEQDGLPEIDVQLTYVHADTEEIRILTRCFSFPALREFFEGLVQGYLDWARMTASWGELRDESIRALEFPFARYRAGQRALTAKTYHALRDGMRLFAQAPTGIGKTMSTLFPAIKAMGEGMCEKLFYLTAKTITRAVAREALCRLRDVGLRLKSVTLTAKEKICFLDTPSCTPEGCPYAKGHFNRINAALHELINNNDDITRETVEQYAKQHTVCPFELSLDATLWADVVICDYNYAFDPRVYLKRFFAQDDASCECVFLVDEAHNLVDRAREMFSAELCRRQFSGIKRALGKSAPRLCKRLGAVIKAFAALALECPDDSKTAVQQELCEELYYSSEHAANELERWLKEHDKGNDRYDDILQLYFDCLTFARTAELFDSRYVTLIDTNNHDVRVKLLCVDPSALLNRALSRARSAVLFSATLTPLHYYKEILGGREQDETLRLPSPFDPDRLRLLLCSTVSTAYRDREGSYDQVTEIIAATVQGRTGNYMVYFPSYGYLEQVYGLFVSLYPHIPTLMQRQGMTEPEREDFLARFEAQSDQTLVGFAVMGGAFSEGVDLQGERLIGTIIVGVGLAQLNPEQDIVRDYFARENSMGFEYAYMYPGMNKVLQAAGRVIRGEDDRGVVVLIDRRFARRDYLALFPTHWHGCLNAKSTAQVAQSLKEFWQMGQ